MGTVLDFITLPVPAPEQQRRHRSTVGAGFWPRIAVVGLLSIVAYVFVIADVLTDVLSGSRAVFVVVLPILTATIAAGYRRAPRGVGDSESDWIIAALGAAVGLTAIRMITNRLPAQAALYHLDLIGIVIWVAATSMVLLGVRYVIRMWDMWLFALCSSSPLPFLLAGSHLGGSDTALAIIATALASIAVLLAGRTHDVTWRVAPRPPV